MRLFIALDIDDQVRGNIVRFMNSIRQLASNARWVRAESLHVTLKFIGERSDQEIPGIKEALVHVRSNSFELMFRGCGFFPTNRAPKTFWIGVDAGAALPVLAATIDERMALIGTPREEHEFHPHLTLARTATRPKRKDRAESVNGGLELLQERLPELSVTEFGKVTAREFFLYRSQTAAGGSKYMKLATFPLG